MMLLYNLDKDQETSIRIFRDLFNKNEMERVLEFLDEKTTFLQELSIFTSFSPVPFLKSIYHMKHRIFTGA
jgi:lycopene beta-cyclase